jgi:hypothetical protein
METHEAIYDGQCEVCIALAAERDEVALKQAALEGMSTALAAALSRARFADAWEALGTVAMLDEACLSMSKQSDALAAKWSDAEDRERDSERRAAAADDRVRVLTEALRELDERHLLACSDSRPTITPRVPPCGSCARCRARAALASSGEGDK